MKSGKSPFPGMDPYLEQFWRDVHHRLCTYACDALQPQLRPALIAQIDERLIVESDSADDRAIFPDVKVAEEHDRLRPAGLDASESEGAVSVAEPPLLLSIEGETPTEGFINIVDPAPKNRLVTVIEFLSPSNKLPGEGQRQYRQKQIELRSAGVSLVEIDLIRTGDWTVDVPMRRVPRSHRTLYRVCVHRGWRGSEYEFYRARINQRLPIVNIPLREKDKDAKLDVQLLIDQTYRNGAYDRINYGEPANPPLEGDPASWAEKMLKTSQAR
jgi:hypothetical protein